MWYSTDVSSEATTDKLTYEVYPLRLYVSVGVLLFLFRDVRAEKPCLQNDDMVSKPIKTAEVIAREVTERRTDTPCTLST